MVEKCHFAYPKDIRLIKGFMDDSIEAWSYCKYFFLFQTQYKEYFLYIPWRCRGSWNKKKYSSSSRP